MLHSPPARSRSPPACARRRRRRSLPAWRRAAAAMRRAAAASALAPPAAVQTRRRPIAGAARPGAATAAAAAAAVAAAAALCALIRAPAACLPHATQLPHRRRFHKALESAKQSEDMWVLLGNAHIADAKARCLADSLRGNSSVTSINLSANQIGDEGVKVTRTALRRLLAALRPRCCCCCCGRCSLAAGARCRPPPLTAAVCACARPGTCLCCPARPCRHWQRCWPLAAPVSS